MDMRKEERRTPPKRLGHCRRAALGLLSLIGALALLGGPVMAQVTPLADTKVRMEPDSPTFVRVIGVTVRAQYVFDMTGYEFTIRFDPQRLQVVDEDPLTSSIDIGAGKIFTGKQTYAFTQVNNETGVLTYSVTALRDSVSGSGSLARIRFRALTEGASELTFDVSKCELTRRRTDQDPNPKLEADWFGATVTAVSGYELALPLTMARAGS